MGVGSRVTEGRTVRTRTEDDVLDMLDDATANWADPSGVDDFIEGDHPDEAIIVFDDGDRWTVKVRRSREGEGVRGDS